VNMVRRDKKENDEELSKKIKIKKVGSPILIGDPTYVRTTVLTQGVIL